MPWNTQLRDENGLKVDPELATGDGGLGFWKALHEIWPKTRQQRCPPGPLGPGSCGDRRKGLLAFAGLELAKSAERHWRKLDGASRLGQLIKGVEFRNGEPVQDAEDKAAA